MSKKVYLIRAGQFYKIGVSGSVRTRLKQIQTGCPIKCEYIGYFPTDEAEAMENKLHQIFRDTKTHGEWFELGDDHIKIMIVDHNLKYIITPFTKTTYENIKISECSELKLARAKTTEIDEFIKIFTGLCDWYELTNEDRKIISSVINEYGIEISVKALYHCLDFSKPDNVLSKLKSSCKAYSDYGRFIPKKVWKFYFSVLNEFNKHEAGKFLHFVMINKFDMADAFYSYFEEVFEKLEMYNDVDHLMSFVYKDLGINVK